MIEGLAQIADRFGTPLHVIDGEALRAAADELTGAFTRRLADTRICFSYKTNPVPAVLRILHERGLGAEVVSPFELWLARRLEVRSEDLVINGTGKRPDYLRASVEADPALFNIHSDSEIGPLSDAAQDASREVRVGLRLAPEGAGDWFGLERDAAKEAAARVVRAPGLSLVGLHGHVGTNRHHVRPYLRMLERMADLAAWVKSELGVELSVVDLGGGFGKAGSRPLGLRDRLWRLAVGDGRPRPVSRRTPSVDEVAAALCRHLRGAFVERGLTVPRLIVEPGRAVSSGAQVLLLRVLDLTTRKDGTRFAVTDGGSMGLVPIVRYEERRIVRLSDRGGPVRRYTLTGPLCTSADVLARRIELPELEVGDLIAVQDAGAYVTPLESTFSFPRPAIVQVEGSAEPRLVRRRETFEDLVTRDDP